MPIINKRTAGDICVGLGITMDVAISAYALYSFKTIAQHAQHSSKFPFIPLVAFALAVGVGTEIIRSLGHYGRHIQNTAKARPPDLGPI